MPMRVVGVERKVERDVEEGSGGEHGPQAPMPPGRNYQERPEQYK